MRPPPRPRVVLLVLATLVPLGCGQEPGPAPDATPSGGAHAFRPDAEPILDFTEFGTVELLEPGVEPREALRFGDRAPSRTIELSFGWVGGPPEEFVVTWAGVEPDRETRRYIYEVVGLGGRWAQQTGDSARRSEAAFGQLAGQAEGTSTGLTRMIQTRGINASPNPGTFFNSFAVPLPSEAIGVGAVWTRRIRGEQLSSGWRERMSRSEEDGPSVLAASFAALPRQPMESYRETAPTDEVSRYTLVERDGDTLTIDFSYTMTSAVAERDRDHDHDMGISGAEASGRFVVALTDPLPQSGEYLSLATFASRPKSSEPIETDPLRARAAIRTR